MKLKLLSLPFCLLVASVNAAQNDIPINYINTKNAPVPFGAYSQGVSVNLQNGKLIFVAGQVARNPMTKKTIEDDIEAATHQTLNNIEAILKASGTDLNHVLRMDVFLRDAKDWNGMNKEYAKHFANGRLPVRQAVQSGIVDRIEMSCIAYVPNS